MVASVLNCIFDPLIDNIHETRRYRPNILLMYRLSSQFVGFVGLFRIMVQLYVFIKNNSRVKTNC